MILKITLGALLLLGTTSAFAQPTITASNAPTAGFSQQDYIGSIYNAGPAGANQSWDFSSQSFSSTPTTYSYAACSSSNNCATFPGSNLVSTGGGVNGYYKVSSTAYSLNGLATNTTSGNLIFSDPEDAIRFPFAYGNSFVDPWTATVVNGGITFYRKGVDSVSADAWGTLKTPAGTFTNTLRTKEISTYRDSANYMGTLFIINYKAYIYSWRDATHKDILYSTSALTTNTGGSANTTNTSGYVVPGTTGVQDAAGGGLDWKVFPNPVKGAAQLSISANTAATAEVTLTDMTGRSVRPAATVSLVAGDNHYSIPTDNLAAGVYMLRLSIDGRSDVRRITVAD